MAPESSVERRTLFVLAIATALFGCTSPPHVQPTSGPTAELNDRLQADADEGNPRVFAIVSINGVEIPNGLNKATRVGSGFGQGLFPYMLARNVEAKPTKYRLRGAYLNRAPIDGLLRQAKGNDQSIEGELIFTPREGGVYRLNGRLSFRDSAVWIEDFETGQIVSETIRSTE